MATEKSTKRLEKENQMDRLSNLPDSLIHHILSMMDVNYAVQSCVLSKRCLDQWMHIPVLNFNSNSMKSLVAYKTMISYVLDNMKTSKLQKMQLHFHKECTIEKYLLYRVVNFAVSHNVEVVDLYFFQRPTLHLPPNIFKCQSLKVLKIQSLASLQLPESFDWACRLKSLSLSKSGIRLHIKKNCFDIFSKCLKLEDLELRGVTIYLQHKFVISAPQLTFLSMDNVKFVDNSGAYEVEINAPGLTSFYLQASVPIELSLVNSPHLDKVNFGINSSFRRYHDVNYCCLVEMTREFCDARSLILSQQVIEHLAKHSEEFEEETSPFVNLKSLTVKVDSGNLGSTSIPLPLLNFFLGNSPSASKKKLVINFPKGTNGNKKRPR